MTLTKVGALKLARAAWGAKANVYMNKAFAESRCRIGVVVFGMMFEVRGMGPTWDDAITNYNAKVERGYYSPRIEWPPKGEAHD